MTPDSNNTKSLGSIHKGRPANPGDGGGLRNADVQLLFDFDSIVFRTQGGGV